MTKEESRKIAINEIFENSRLSDFGFKYLKSKSFFEKRNNNIVYNVGFGSTKTNILDNVNILIVNAGVTDNGFASWQKEKLGNYPSGQIGCAKIKNLFIDGPPWYDFDLTEEDEIKKLVINEVSNILKSDVLLFFQICDDPLKILDKLNSPCFSVNTIIEYFEYKKLQKLIPDIIEKKSEEYPDLKGEVDFYLNYFKSNNKPIGGFKETYTDKTKLIASQIAETLTKINNS